MTESQNSFKNAGFTVFEIVVVIAIIGILAAIAIQFIGYDYRKAIKVADAKKTIRELQIQSIYFMEEHGSAPTIEDLDKLYHRNGNNTLVGLYDVISSSDDSDSDKGHGNDCDKFDEDNPGNKKGNGKGPSPHAWVSSLSFENLIIHTVSEIDGDKIVYGVDDHPPVVELASLLPLVCRINPNR